MLQALSSLFPQNDFSLLAVVIGMPLLGALVNGIWGKRLGKQAVTLMALAAVGVSFLAAVVTFACLAGAVAGPALAGASAEAAAEPVHHEHVRLAWTAWKWMHTTGSRENDVAIPVRLSVDALSGVMMLVITGVGFLIHLYSTAYMAEDKGYARFFTYLNLFIFSMLILVLGDNLPILFVGWEGVGLCSYLLIGFWYDKNENAAAGKKAFIANRIGDFGLICAMFLLVHYTGALDWAGIESGAKSLGTIGEQTRVHVWPLGGGQYTGRLSFLQPSTPLTISAATAVCLSILLGCTGKSAQLPLYVWLPDAMAGPTPVSALIHAATMVTAGVYLICRLSFIFVMSPFTMMVVAIIGVATAFFAATIALVQNDIKKVLAYSTVSQLGFMFLGVGVGAFAAGFFHVFTHAFFKACLFLGAGSVIHAMHARIHDDVKAQDIRNMGGLYRTMPLTFWTFAAATAAIIGLPLTSGFFSKDEILFKSFVSHPINPLNTAEKVSFYKEAPAWLSPILYTLAVAAATMTAFYMCRLFILTFLGEFRGWTVGRSTSASHHGGGHGHHHDDLTQPGPPPHESPWPITVPLIILGTASLFAGFLNAGMFHFEPMTHWLEPVFEAATAHGVRENENAHAMMWPLAAGGFGAFAIGSGLSYWMYILQKGAPAKALAEAQPAFHQLLLDKWRVDELYDVTIVAAVESLAETSVAFDRYIVDGILARVSAAVVQGAGIVLRAFQTGVVHVYATFMVVGLLVIGWFTTMPHPDVTIQQTGDDFVLTAGPGLSYGYRWDADGDGKPDTEEFGATTNVKIHLEADKTSQTVRLEVKNVLGLTGSRDIVLEKPKPKLDKSPDKLIKVGQR